MPVGHLLPLPGQRVTTVPGGAGRLLDAALELVEPDGRRPPLAGRRVLGRDRARRPGAFLVDRERGQLVFRATGAPGGSPGPARM